MEYKGFSTKQIHQSHPHLQGVTPLATPIFQSSTFVFDSTDQGARRFLGQEEGFIYTRMGNPNANEVSGKIAALESCEAGIVLGSGMGAVTTAVWSLIRSGDRILADTNLYGCTHSYFNHGLTRFGIGIDMVDFCDLEAVKCNLRPETRIVYFESCTNPSMKVIDIKAVSDIVHGYNKDIKIIIDNTFCTPYITRPKELGADVILHSATKYLNGHGDVIAGVLCGDADVIHEMNMFGLKDMTGAVIGPFEAFLINRGLKTLDIRMERHSRNAMVIAEYLEAHPMVKSVAYPGLKSHPQYEIAQRQMALPGGMISFELKADRATTSRFLNSMKMCALAVSLGDAETLIEHPASMTHSALSPEELAVAGIGESMVRLSVGLEDTVDIIADLEQAFDCIK